MLLELLRKDEAKIAQVGIRAIERARLAGVPCYYIDEALGEGIVKHMPDGVRHLIALGNDTDVILKTFPPGI